MEDKFSWETNFHGQLDPQKLSTQKFAMTSNYNDEKQPHRLTDPRKLNATKIKCKENLTNEIFLP